MSKNKKKNSNLRGITLFMEKFWLVLAILSFIVVMYLFLTEGATRQTTQYLVFPFLAGLMYGFRVFFRKRMEKTEDL